MKVRVKCPKCGEVLDIESNSPCPKCQEGLSVDGEAMLQIYRMGSPIGVAVGYGIYLDGQPMGHIANKESIKIPVKAGQHNLHMTCGMTRRCKDLSVSVNPGELKCIKARIKAGFWTNTIIIEPAELSEMPAE